MKAIEISQKTHLVRHWFKWYRVQRGGTDWQPLEIKKRTPPFSVDRVAKALSKKYPTAAKLPDILDEKAADAEVAKNTPKTKK